ncbi:hypothetical protein GCM10009623_36510 [Nocardioides aestuarii]
MKVPPKESPLAEVSWESDGAPALDAVRSLSAAVGVAESSAHEARRKTANSNHAGAARPLTPCMVM